jgi:tetratricopeptide (TPR) repeat protein
MTDYFAVLGLKRSASDREIREAYRRLAKKYHPDSNPNDAESARRMQAINEAKAVLSDPVKREEHKIRLSLTENFSSSHIEALRNDPRFRKTTTYRTPTPAQRRPSSKWDKLWKKYLVAFAALIILGSAGVVAYEIMSNPHVSTDPVKDIISRYEQLESENGRLPERLDDSLLAALNTLEITSDSAQKLRKLGDISFGFGNYQSAVKYYEMYLRKAPENDTVVGNLSYALFKQGQYAQTLEVLSLEMRSDSNLVTAYYNIGELFLREDKPFDARDAFRASAHIADSMTNAGHHPPHDALLAKNELARLE